MKYRKSEIPLQSFTKVFVSPNYGVETLINGNITECIEYLKDLLETGNVGIQTAYEELENIKNQVPDRYNFIKTSVFAYSKYSDFRKTKP
jgi:hypothetical protein